MGRKSNREREYIFLYAADFDRIQQQREKTLERAWFWQQVEARIAQRALPPADERKIILVVDDEAQIRNLVRQELEPEGFVVREAANGQEALERIRRERPLLVLIDIMMPEMNGSEAAALIKTDPLSMDLPLIIMSVIDEHETGYHFGIDRYPPSRRYAPARPGRSGLEPPRRPLRKRFSSSALMRMRRSV